MTSNFVRSALSLYVTPLTKLINSAFTTGEFPDLLKEACVVPVHKGGDMDDMNNYRPISVLPTFSKLFERAMHSRISERMEVTNSLYDHQYGFRKKRSTGDAVLKFSNNCLSAFEAGEYCVTLFLDLSRAFDCVSHPILLHKLKNAYGFDYLSLRLIESYLSNRQQRVVAGDTVSGSLLVNRGVPQGSILGPLLFLIFFNDFPNFIKIDESVECIIYADDATIMVHGKALDEALVKSEEVLERVRDWTVANQLSLNENKTVKMAFSLRGVDFQNPQHTKFLGISINPPALKFDEHAHAAGSKICRNIFVLRRLASAVTADVLLSAYFALIHCHINYCVLVWGGSSASDYIFKIQRRAIRVIGDIGFRDDCRQSFVDLKILTVPCVYILACILYANAHKHSFSTNGDYHNYETRSRHDIRLEYCRLTKTQRGSMQVAMTLFNKLPPDCRNLTNPVLRMRLKCFLLKKAFYSVKEFLNYSHVIL